ncbi:MAG: hypothetical protein LBI64_08655 [Coriobacteriales bacterium]|jgi:flotillin|nr:hypothetical protein [Coriobacteriales bacterium]
MDVVFQAFSALGWIIGAFILIVFLLICLLIFKIRYKVAKSNQALVITGGKRGLRVLTAGGALVPPIVRRHEFFPLDVMTVISDNKETQTKTVVPVVVTWTAQLKPDVETPGSLEKAVMGFIGKGSADIERSLQQTLEGEMRAVVATLTPEEVIEGREKFKNDVEGNVKARMEELGFKLISLNITEVKDNKGHYDNLAAKDREEKRRIAENLTAVEQKAIDITAAETTQQSETARIAKELVIAEKDRDLNLKQSEYQAETDRAKQDAIYAGKVREQERQKDLAVTQGAVAIERERQNQLAAEAHRSVETTMAETDKQKMIINAEATREQVKIEAEAAARKNEIDADAAAIVAQKVASGEAKAAREKAAGEADAVRAKAEADAEQIRKTGLAEAEKEKALGEARGAAILAEGQAKAEAERLMAEALAANDEVNLKVTLAEIQRDTTIKVWDGISTAMASVGEKATFIDMGGNAREGDLLTNVLGNVPELLKKLDVKNNALNGKALSGSLEEIASAISGRTADRASDHASDHATHRTQPEEPQIAKTGGTGDEQ